MAALTFQQAYDNVIALAGTVGHRTEIAIVTAAQTIYAELNTTPGHAARAALATKVLNTPDAYVQPFTFVVATDPTIVAGGVIPTDAQILTAVTNAWNAMAGA